MSNPYEAPRSSETTRIPEAQRGKFRLLWAWGLVFLLNLPVPIILAMPFTTRYSLFGLVAIVALFLSLGLVVCRRFAGFGQCLVAGGLLTALSQFIPFLQLFSGLVAINSAQSFGFTIDNPQSNDGAIRFLLPSMLGVIWTALVTASIIGGCAISLGLILKMLFPKLLDYLLPIVPRELRTGRQSLSVGESDK